MGAAPGVDKPQPAQLIMAAVRTTPGSLGWRQSGRLKRGWLANTTPLQEVAGTRDVAMTAVVAEDAVMADADQADRQNVAGESADELDRAQGQSLDLGSMTIVAVSEGDGLGLRVQRHDAAIADGHPMGVVGQVSQDLFGTAKGAFGIDDPTSGVKLGKPASARRSGDGEGLRQTEGVRILEQLLKAMKKLAAKQCGHGADREKELSLLG